MTRELLLEQICANACINNCRFIGCSQCNEKLKEMANNSSTKYIRLSEKETITTYGVEQIAEQLKAGGKE